MKKLIAAILLFSVNCGSIIHQTTQHVPVKSDPPGAAVTVACGDVSNDPKLVTPTVVTVHRKPDFCTIALTKEGYERVDVPLRKTMSALYLGNVLVGGIIGFIVDAANGAMWNRTPATVDVTLKEAVPAEAVPAATTTN
jgi:hypothetical protein